MRISDWSSDGCSSDLPALYDAFHDLLPVIRREGPLEPHDIVGPSCESTDVFARGRMLPALQAGDLVAFMSAGEIGRASCRDGGWPSVTLSVVVVSYNKQKTNNVTVVTPLLFHS